MIYLLMPLIFMGLLNCSFFLSPTLEKVNICDKDRVRFKNELHYIIYNYNDELDFIDSSAIEIICSSKDSVDRFEGKLVLLFYKKTFRTTVDYLSCRPKPFLHNPDQDRVASYIHDIDDEKIVAFKRNHGEPFFSEEKFALNCNDK